MSNNKNKALYFGVSVVGGLLLAGITIYTLSNGSLGSSCNLSDKPTCSTPCVIPLISENNNAEILFDKDYPPRSCLGNPKSINPKDMDIARIAWKYFENNYQPKTGLYNSVDRYTSTTLWDTGSALAAVISAHDLGLITKKDFDDRVVKMLSTLKSLKLFNNEAPNKVYSTLDASMVDYGNKPTETGIGVSAIDLARIISWLNTLATFHPKYQHEAKMVISGWDYTRLIGEGQMYGLMVDPVTKKTVVVQEGRLGYEQYSGKVFEELGFNQKIASTYYNKFTQSTTIMDVPILYDQRDPRDLGAYNYVVTESYVLDGMEHGVDDENRVLISNIFQTQENRFKRTGVITAVSEDNLDRQPYFLYNTIFASGLPWNTTTDRGVIYNHYKTISVKAAMSLAAFFPERDYSKVLINRVESAYDAERGWYSGMFESGLGYNSAISGNTNGIILSLFLYQRYGATYPISKRCARQITLDSKIIKRSQCKKQCVHK
ncbi:MAG: DUF3131 domain-containing protein [Thiotrichaceae bacterium]|nr:DUF3131 domain-containing protein [Thiotrichaceae bacterium]